MKITKDEVNALASQMLRKARKQNKKIAPVLTDKMKQAAYDDYITYSQLSTISKDRLGDYDLENFERFHLKAAQDDFDYEEEKLKPKDEIVEELILKARDCKTLNELEMSVTIIL